MRSGNGRHRRPRQAPAIVVAAGVTGSAIAIPLLGAGSASAAEPAAWDRVAECESGGLWSADTGNGYYGGLQLSQRVWEEFGGTEYASRADLASRSQQIAVAEKVLAAQGEKAWASCAGIAGLTDRATGTEKGTGKSTGTGTGKATDKSTGTGTDKSTGTDKGAATGRSETDGTSGGASATPSAPGQKGGATTTPKPATGSTTPGAGPTQGVGSGADRAAAATAGAGKHRGEPADEPTKKPEGTTGAADSADSAGVPGSSTPPPATEAAEPGGTASGTPSPANEAAERRAADPGHASRGAGAARDGAVGATVPGDKKVEVVKGTAGGAGASPTSYTVQPGDSLWAIAEERKLDGGWNALYEKNRTAVGSDPDLIHPGQSLDLDAKQG
ncbi:transglycosylase family protein [Streptomyces sp. NPDC020965]|uniref:transglycosylase family protein n=1 Tax=Streptomyces sp. NPDC020965 TaxID=3365105 RepID=UPI003793B1FD